MLGNTEAQVVKVAIGTNAESGFNREGILVMQAGYAAYFDSSEGQRSISPHSDPVAGTYVGGFVSSVASWEKFEIDWTLALASYQVSFFHMRDYIANRRQFFDDKWKSKKYRAEFISTLIDIIDTHAMYSIVRGLWHPYFEALNGQFLLADRFNPYAVCGLACALEAREYIRANVSSCLPIEYVFEQGDNGAELLRKEMLAVGLPEPVFRPNRIIEKNPEWTPSIQLQACDLIAWEVRRESNRQRILIKEYPLRKSIQALERIPHAWNNHTLDTLESFCVDRYIARRGKNEESKLS